MHHPPIDATKYKTLTAQDVPPCPANYASRSTGSTVAAILNITETTGVENVAPSTPSRHCVAAVMPSIDWSSWVDEGN